MKKIQNRKIIFAVVVLFSALVSIYFFFPDAAKIWMKDGAAIAVHSWADTIGAPREEDIASEIDLASSSGIGLGLVINEKSADATSMSGSISVQEKSKKPVVPKKKIISKKNVPAISTTTIAVDIAIASSIPSLAVSPRVIRPSANFSVNTSLAGDGRGMVTSSPPGITCGVICAWNFSNGTTVTLFGNENLSRSESWVVWFASNAGVVPFFAHRT